MFEYFPENYAWSLAVMLANTCGGAIGEIDDACRPLKPFAAQRDEAASIAWAQHWCAVADQVALQARADDEAGRLISGGRKHRRSSVYYMMAERQMRHANTRRMDVYRSMLHEFGAWQKAQPAPAERCSVPYGDQSLPALWIDSGVPRGPCLVMFDGFDIMKETICLMDMHEDFRQRGISLLIVDHPGVGEALRVHGLKGMPETELPARASLEYLLTRQQVDPNRIGIMAPSAGGYHAVRSAALEPRFACCVAWTGVWDWGRLFERRLKGQLAQSVHFHLEHAEWVYGAVGVDEVVARMSPMNLAGIAEKLRCPLLITHGADDRQTPVEQAQRVFDAASNSVDRKLRIFRKEDGASEHCHVDNQSVCTDFMADWVAETLGGQTRRS